MQHLQQEFNGDSKQGYELAVLCVAEMYVRLTSEYLSTYIDWHMSAMSLHNDRTHQQVQNIE